MSNYITSNYITLPSNSSYKYYPNNKSSDYRVHLARELKYKGDYEVALVQFLYTHSWYNLPERACNIEIKRTIIYNNPSPDIYTSDVGREYIRYYYGKLTPGNYQSPLHLIEALNKTIAESLKNPVHPIPEMEELDLPDPLAEEDVGIRTDFFKYDTISHKVSIESDNAKLRNAKRGYDVCWSDLFVFYFHPELNVRLGFTDCIDKSYTVGLIKEMYGDYKKGQYMTLSGDEIICSLQHEDKGEMTVDVSVGLNNIYVYSDVMAQINFVGDTIQSCLRVIPTNIENRNKRVIFEPANYHFFPLRSNTIRDIGVELRTELGELVPFERDSTVITICVRRTRPFGG